MRRAGSGILAAAAGAVTLAAAACGSIHQAAAPNTPGSIQAAASRSAQEPPATVSPGVAVPARYDPCARSFPGMPVGRALASLYAGSLVTVTDPAQVRRIVALVDGLPLSPPGVFHCPLDGGASLVLTFRAQPGGPALAVAEPDLEGCEWVSFTIGGKPQPSLGPPNGGRPFADSVVRIAGLPWNLSKMLM